MFSAQIHKNLYLLGLCICAYGMMMGRFPTSFGPIFLGANWLLEMDFKRKWEQVKSNFIFWLLFSLFLIHLPGLFYTDNMQSGLNDLRVKMPLFALPLIFFSSKPLSAKELRVVLICFIVGCFTNTLWCLIYNFILHPSEQNRETSRFMSHIRLGLYLSLVIFVAAYLAKEVSTILKRIIFISIGVYFLFSLFALGLISGLVIALVVGFLLLLNVIHKQKFALKLTAYFLLIVSGLVFFNYIKSVIHKQSAIKPTGNNKIQKLNSAGREYVCYSNNGHKENGNQVLINIQPEELMREWNKRAPADTFNFAQKYNLARFDVLIRYLASKGLNKDSMGISALSNHDISNIQKNIPNYLYPDWGFLQKRIYELINEYDDFKNNRHVSGRSLTMRLYFWKAALHAISNNFLFGVATGDVQEVMNKSFEETNSPIQKEWYLRPHNQFLSIFLGIGIIGFLIFLVIVFYPPYFLRRQVEPIFWPFYLILIYSFLFEDTLESQAGTTFYAFFNSLFISQAYFRFKTKQTPEDLQALH